jgi:cell division protein FtsX
VEKRPKLRVRGLLAAFIHRSFTVDGFLIGLLGVPDGIVIMALFGCMPLIELTLILLVAGVRGW